jgi:mycothiol synthase
MNTLSPDYRLRHPTAADLPAIQHLVDECDSADCGEPRVSDWDFAAEAADPDAHPEQNWWVLEHADGGLAGLATLEWPATGEARGIVYVLPRHSGRQLSAYLFNMIETRARELAAGAAVGSAPALFMRCEDSQPERQTWLLAHGYRRVRELFGMRADLTHGSAAPVWPLDIAVRDMRPHVDDEALWAAGNDAFSEHFLSYAPSLEAWRAWIYGHAGLDPSLWLVAWDGEEVAGMAMAMPLGDAVWVDDVMVRRPWRSRGLGLALLLELFARLHERGRDDVSLWVDSENATGAVRLYEAAGMHVWRHMGVFKLELAQA